MKLEPLPPIASPLPQRFRYFCVVHLPKFSAAGALAAILWLWSANLPQPQQAVPVRTMTAPAVSEMDANHNPLIQSLTELPNGDGSTNLYFGTLLLNSSRLPANE